MNDIFLSQEDMGKELMEIEKQGIDLTQKLSLLTQKIKYIFAKLKSCENIKEADPYLDILQNVQRVLAVLIFREKLGLTESLTWFAEDFDRIDDKELREYIFQKIKSGEYYFGKKI